MARPSRAEAAAWLLFSAGGMVSALLVPVLVLLFGLLFPLGVLAPPDHAALAALLSHPLVRYTLFDGLQLARLRIPINVLCYAAVLAGSVWAAFVLFR